MATTLLSTIIARMQRYQIAYSTEQNNLVADIDEAMRNLRRETQLPWMLKRSTLRVFDGVLLYPTATDHDFLAYLDTQDNNDIGSQGFYGDRLRAVYTSLQQFWEDPDNRNRVAEIWTGNTKYLGVRDKIIDAPSTQIDDASDTSGYTASGDASGISLDTVNFTTGISSIKFNITLNSGAAEVKLNPFLASISNPNYLQNYFFIWVYLSGTPTSITLKFGNDSSNYLSNVVTTQFAGEPFLAGGWNLLAIDLNVASVTGTINANDFHYFSVNFVNAPTGVYNVDASYFRQWELLDYWYYSKFMVQTNGATAPDREYFNATFNDYSLDASLIGDSEWVDVVMYDALLLTMGDKEDDRMTALFQDRRDKAWSRLLLTYPSSKPVELNLNWRFTTDYADDFYYNDPIS